MPNSELHAKSRTNKKIFDSFSFYSENLRSWQQEQKTGNLKRKLSGEEEETMLRFYWPFY